MARRKKRKDVFRVLGSTAVGLGGLTVTTTVSAAAAGRAIAVGGAGAAPAAPILTSFQPIARAAPIATLAVTGGGILGQLRQLNKPRKKRRR